MNRREALMGAAVALSLVASASPAQAFLGFGDDSKIQENYNTETVGMDEPCAARMLLPRALS